MTHRFLLREGFAEEGMLCCSFRRGRLCCLLGPDQSLQLRNFVLSLHEEFVLLPQRLQDSVHVLNRLLETTLQLLLPRGARGRGGAVSIAPVSHRESVFERILATEGLICVSRCVGEERIGKSKGPDRGNGVERMHINKNNTDRSFPRSVFWKIEFMERKDSSGQSVGFVSSKHLRIPKSQVERDGGENRNLQPPLGCIHV